MITLIRLHAMRFVAAVTSRSDAQNGVPRRSSPGHPLAFPRESVKTGPLDKCHPPPAKLTVHHSSRPRATGSFPAGRPAGRSSCREKQRQPRVLLLIYDPRYILMKTNFLPFTTYAKLIFQMEEQTLHPLSP